MHVLWWRNIADVFLAIFLCLRIFIFNYCIVCYLKEWAHSTWILIFILSIKINNYTKTKYFWQRTMYNDVQQLFHVYMHDIKSTLFYESYTLKQSNWSIIANNYVREWYLSLTLYPTAHFPHNSTCQSSTTVLLYCVKMVNAPTYHVPNAPGHQFWWCCISEYPHTTNGDRVFKMCNARGWWHGILVWPVLCNVLGIRQL